MKDIKEEQFGLAAIGMELPKVFLFAADLGRAKSNQGTKVKKEKGAKIPSNALFKIQFSENDLEARIEAYQSKIRSPQFDLSKKQLLEEIKGHGISVGYEKHLDPILNAIALKQELKDMVVAHGIAPEVGNSPLSS